jgi:hypothetical protein
MRFAKRLTMKQDRQLAEIEAEEDAKKWQNIAERMQSAGSAKISSVSCQARWKELVENMSRLSEGFSTQNTLKPSPRITTGTEHTLMEFEEEDE